MIMESARKQIKSFGMPRIIISALFLGVFLTASYLDIPMGGLVSDVIRRFGMFGILALAIVPSIQCGTGPNFALPIGIICGLLGSVLAIEFGLTGKIWGYGFIPAVLFSIPMSVITGWAYALLLNRIKGSEMVVATFTGFSIVSFMQIGWVALPFKANEMRWPIGQGLRTTISLESSFGQVLNKLWGFNIGSVYIPTGLLLFFIGCCFLVWLFSRSKAGVAMRVAGENPKFAAASGINVDNNRILGTVLSTVIGGIGIIVYSLSFGYMQLYLGPLYAAIPAIAAVLIGGATIKKAKISHVFIGILLFQGLLAMTQPVANQLFPEGDVADVLRQIVQNGVILYALTKIGEDL